MSTILDAIEAKKSGSELPVETKTSATPGAGE